MSELHRAYCFPLFSGSDGLFTIRDGALFCSLCDSCDWQ
jgi:hypothetical protein